MVKPGEKCLSCGEPSEPTLPPLPNPIATSKYWDAGIDRPLAGERAARLERQDQLLAAQREIQQLRQRVEDLEGRDRAGTRFLRKTQDEVDELRQQLGDAGNVLGEICVAGTIVSGEKFLPKYEHAAISAIMSQIERAEDAEAKVRGLSARFICQAELEGGKHAHGHTIQDIYDDRDASDGWTHDC